jgi:hypothetical protein
MVLSTFAIIFLVGMLIATRPIDPPAQHAKTERNTPPPAPQPFDKKWVAPSETKGIGGEADREVAPPVPDTQLDSTPTHSTPQVPVLPKKLREPRKMKGPWDFPRL